MNNEQREALTNASLFSLKLIQCVKEPYEYIKNEKIAEGYQLVASMTDGFKWLTEVITLYEEVLIEKIDVSKLNETIGEMIESIENRDNGLLGDLLEYEMIELLEEWQEIIGRSLEG